MPRLSLNTNRTEKTQKTYLGKMLLFCEGITEYNYFNYFAKIINLNRDKFSNIIIEFEKVGGNARTVFEYANNYLSENNNSSKYHNYEKYLIFDCDDPKEIQDLINEIECCENHYKLLLTNFLFEIWLIMHFQDLDEELKKRESFKIMAEFLSIKNYTSRQKSSEGMIRKIINNGDNIIKAIENAKKLDTKYKEEGYLLNKDIKKMNPFTTVHTLVEELLSEISHKTSYK